jgi:hypothetical protein
MFFVPLLTLFLDLLTPPSLHLFHDAASSMQIWPISLPDFLLLDVFFYPLLDVIGYDAEITQLGAIAYGAEL